MSQQQFWKPHKVADDSDGRVNGVLSIDISNWTSPGTNGKSAQDCTPDEMCAEVLTQIRACLGDAPGVDLGDDNIDSYFIDPDVVFFDGREAWPRRTTSPCWSTSSAPGGSGPTPGTEIPNLYLAGDFVRNHTDLATMEGANEAARRAVNAIIRGQGLDAPLCASCGTCTSRMLFAPLRWIDARRFAKGKPWSDRLPPSDAVAGRRHDPVGVDSDLLATSAIDRGGCDDDERLDRRAREQSHAYTQWAPDRPCQDTAQQEKRPPVPALRGRPRRHPRPGAADARARAFGDSAWVGIMALRVAKLQVGGCRLPKCVAASSPRSTS